MMDGAERSLLEHAVHDALANAGDHLSSVDAVLAGLGWLQMLDEEPGDAIGIVFADLGACNATASALDDVVVSGLGLTPRPDLAALLPPFGSRVPPGTAQGYHVHGAGLATARAATASELCVVVVTATGDHRCLVVPTAAAQVRALGGIDPTACMQDVRLEAYDTAGVTLDPAAWKTATAAAQRAVAHQISGACRAMLDLARAHAAERVQFGRPIARFQAVRHRLAEGLIAIEALEAALGAAAEEPDTMTAALSKAVAGRTARMVAGHCQQVLAGIGFTTDHPFHRFLKRTMLLDGLFGAAETITTDLGHQLLAGRRVPTLIDL